jgi:hypothetical protein
VQGKVIQLPRQHEGFPDFPIGFDGGKREGGILVLGKTFDGVKDGFCRGFYVFKVFCGGKSVVSLWWNAC